MISNDTARVGAHYWLMGMQVQVLHLAFSDATLAGVLGCLVRVEV